MLAVPSFFDDLPKKSSNEPGYLMPENSVTPPNHIVDNTEAIMGFDHPGNTRSPPISNDFPTEVIFTNNLLLGAPLSPVQEEDPSTSYADAVEGPLAKANGILAQRKEDFSKNSGGTPHNDAMEAEDIPGTSNQQVDVHDGFKSLGTAPRIAPSINGEQLTGSHALGDPSWSTQRLVDGQNMDHNFQNNDPGPRCESKRTLDTLPVASPRGNLFKDSPASQYQSPNKSHIDHKRRVSPKVT